MSRFNLPRGTHDVLPGEAPEWRFAEAAFADVAHRFGYQEIRTPAFESTELFSDTSGETSEIVTKQMYTFLDKGGRSMTLKPEGTAPAGRAYLEHRLGQPGHVTRLWYTTQIFRYERPKRGRYRQAHQFGVELFGSRSPRADAEVIELAVEFYRAVEINDLEVKINSIGQAETRARYGDVILAHVRAWLAGLSTEDQARAQRNPLRLLDTKDDDLRAALDGLPSILDYLDDASAQRFESLQLHLDAAHVSFRVQPDIVRGLDYYTETVFEVHSPALGAETALCGGGRYDNLISEKLGGPPTPAVGVGIGIERALLVRAELGTAVEPPCPDAFIVAATDIAIPVVERLARELRNEGRSILTDLDGLGLRQQFKFADRCGARFAVVLGEDELEAGTFTLKDLQTGEQGTVDRAALSERLQAR